MTKTYEEERQELLALLEAKELELRYNKFKYRFPDDGKYARVNYPKHTQFMNMGANHNMRLFMGGNRTGKTEAGAYEMTCHLTGLYPHWWEGRKFLNPISAWAAGVTNQSVKEIQQLALLGPINDIGSGMIPRDLLVGNPTKKPGVAGAIETIYVRHRSGGVSELTFKSYEQGRENFQGTQKQVIWEDEEPRDYGVHEECTMRIFDEISPGLLYCTFTPLFGMTQLVQSFLEEGRVPHDGVPEGEPNKFVTQVTWDEVPHLSEEQKKSLISSIQPHLRDARTKGIPNLGAGAIFPLSEDEIVVEPFRIPEFWPRAYGLDVGWGGTTGQGGKTACIWIVQNPDTEQYFLYSEHYESHSIPAVHAEAIKARGRWIHGVIDSQAIQTSATDGKSLLEQYESLDLLLEPSQKAKEAGIQKIYQMLLAGQLKVFNTLKNWLNEYRQYTRDENGKIKDKQKDDLMDATNYLMLLCPDILSYPEDPSAYRAQDHYNRDDVTGY
jgi:phage terminase large subunit-like protein